MQVSNHNMGQRMYCCSSTTVEAAIDMLWGCDLLACSGDRSAAADFSCMYQPKQTKLIYSTPALRRTAPHQHATTFDRAPRVPRRLLPRDHGGSTTSGGQQLQLGHAVDLPVCSCAATSQSTEKSSFCNATAPCMIMRDKARWNGRVVGCNSFTFAESLAVLQARCRAAFVGAAQEHGPETVTAWQCVPACMMLCIEACQSSKGVSVGC
jgi:hypothetical protein